LIRGSRLSLLPPLQPDPPSVDTGIWRIGASGWSYPPRTGPGTWTGVFYPLKKTDELRFYSRYFNTVEVNSTFYHPCSPKSADGWVERTPEGFEFTVKAWQEFTHGKAPLVPADVRIFQEGIQPLADAGKLGILLFQFPASFHSDDLTRDRLRQLLGMFAEYSTAVEFRHRSWDDNLDVLEDTRSIPVFIDEPKFRDSTRQRLGSSSGILYTRFHGRQAEKWWHHEHRNERYDYLYTANEIRPHAERLKAAAAEQAIQKAYVFFNNHPGAKAVVNAVMLREELGIPVTEELPQTLTAAFPQILRRG
jgi:uncharacterized protein YecE (DUF72 family)